MSEENNKDLSAFMHKATENNISVTINGKACIINAFFSVNILEKYFALYDKYGDYRMAFSQTVYKMYAKTEKETSSDDESLNEQDFLSATDEELSAIISDILEKDGATKREYDKSDCKNIFERFYNAHKNIIDASLSGIEKTLLQQQKRIDQSISPALLTVAKQMGSMQFPQLNPKITESLKVISALQLPQMDSGFAKIVAQQEELSRMMKPFSLEGITNLQSAMQPFAESTARIMSAINYSGVSNAVSAMADSLSTQVNHLNITTGLQSLIDSIPRVEFDFAKIADSLIAPLQEIGSKWTDNLRSPLELLGQSLASIDFSLLTYHKKWDERHDILLSYGWFYLNELPEELINDIYERQEELNVDEVNTLIVTYFRSDRCAALKRIVKSWKESRYFAHRNTVFHEALVNHSRRCYNASVTLTTLHTEGVITDFVRLAFKNPRFHAERALSDIHSYMDDMPYSTLTFSDWQIFDSVIAEIQTVLTGKFDLANPEAAANNSRHKIAHGHAVDKETEESSLKHFLYLNELHRMFSVLDKELESAKCSDRNVDSSDV